MNHMNRKTLRAALVLTAIFFVGCSTHTTISPSAPVNLAPHNTTRAAEQYAEALAHAHDVLDWHNCTWLGDGRNTMMSDCEHPPYGEELIEVISAYEVSHNASLVPWDVERAADGTAVRVYYTWSYRRHPLCPDGICSDH